MNRQTMRFKRDCVEQILLNGLTVGEASALFQVGKRKLYTWIQDYKRGCLVVKEWQPTPCLNPPKIDPMANFHKISV